MSAAREPNPAAAAIRDSVMELVSLPWSDELREDVGNLVELAARLGLIDGKQAGIEASAAAKRGPLEPHADAASC